MSPDGLREVTSLTSKQAKDELLRMISEHIEICNSKINDTETVLDIDKMNEKILRFVSKNKGILIGNFKCIDDFLSHLNTDPKDIRIETYWICRMILSGLLKDNDSGVKKAVKGFSGIVDGIQQAKEISFIPQSNTPAYRSMKAIEKWRKYAKENNDTDLIANLDGMKLIADDELQLRDGTVVKLGYPDIPADDIEIFERIVKDTDGRDIRVVYFKNREGGAFQKYVEEMEQRGFRLPGNKNDTNGRMMSNEFRRIFEKIKKEGTPNYSTIIIDILGRAFSGYLGINGVHRGKGIGEDFLSFSPSSIRGYGYICGLGCTDTLMMFFENPYECIFPVLFVKFPEEQVSDK